MVGSRYTSRGRCCEKDGDVDQALDDYNEGVRIGGPRHKLLWSRGRLLSDLGRWSEANEDLSSAKDLQPSHDATVELLQQAQEQMSEMQLQINSSTTVPGPEPEPRPIVDILHNFSSQSPLPIGCVGCGLQFSPPRPTPRTCPMPLPCKFNSKTGFVHDWCSSRADLLHWMKPLYGSTLVCDCNGTDCPAAAYQFTPCEFITYYVPPRVEHVRGCLRCILGGDGCQQQITAFTSRLLTFLESS